MLLPRSHRCHAFKRAPERETKELWFANGTPGPQQPNPGGIPPGPNIQVSQGQGVQDLNNPQQGTPNQAAEGAENAQEAQPAENVNTQRAETRGDVEGAMQQREELSVNKVREQVEKMRERLTNLHKKMGDMEVHMKALKVSSKTMNRWREDETTLALAVICMNGWSQIIEKISLWEGGQVAPADMWQWFRQTAFPPKWSGKDRNKPIPLLTPAQMHAMQQRIGPMPDDDQWQTIGNAERYAIIRDLQSPRGPDGTELPLFPTKSVLEFFNVERKILDTALSESQLEEKIKKMEEILKQKKDEDEREKQGDHSGHGKGIRESIKEALGIEFYTIPQIIEAGKSWWEAIKEAHKQHDHHKSAKLASVIGRIGADLVLYGKDAQNVLDNTLRKHDDEVTSSYKEYLGRRFANFKYLFTPGTGELDRNKHDHNRAKAILEYAAEKGWLYDLPDQQTEGTPLNNMMILGRWKLRDLVGHDVSKEDYENYWAKLHGMNEGGKSTQADSAKKFYGNIERPSVFYKALQGALNDGDLWFAKGIMDRAVDKGYAGEMSSTLAMILLRHLRQGDSMTRKYISLILLNDMGNISAYSPAFTLGAYKFERKTIHPWTKSGSTNIAEAGEFGTVVSKIENTIERKAGKGIFSPEERDKEVALILSANLREVAPGRFVSIFHPDFHFYAGKLRAQGEMDINKYDEDFFRQRSEALLCDRHTISQKILTTDTMGNLQNARSAQFMRQVFLANDDFSMAMNKAADESERRYLRACEENYRKIMQAKFGDWMEKIGGDQRNKNVTAMKTVEEQPRYIVLELLRRQLIPIEKLEVATDTTTAILKQCIDHRNYIGESQPHDANLQQQAAQMLRDRGVTVPGGQQGGQQRRAA